MAIGRYNRHLFPSALPASYQAKEVRDWAKDKSGLMWVYMYLPVV